jgi:hypothetical protein
MKDLVEYIDGREPAPKKRGPYKKKAALGFWLCDLLHISVWP